MPTSKLLQLILRTEYHLCKLICLNAEQTCFRCDWQNINSFRLCNGDSNGHNFSHKEDVAWEFLISIMSLPNVILDFLNTEWNHLSQMGNKRGLDQVHYIIEKLCYATLEQKDMTVQMVLSLEFNWTDTWLLYLEGVFFPFPHSDANYTNVFVHMLLPHLERKMIWACLYLCVPSNLWQCMPLPFISVMNTESSVYAQNSLQCFRH